MTDSTMDERMRGVEEYCHKNEGATKERWKNQESFNARQEGLNAKMEKKMDNITESVNKISSNIRLNNFKITAIYIGVQAVMYVVATFIYRVYFVVPK